MSSSAGITLLRAVDHTRTENQLRPGEGFAPDYTPVADRVTSMDAGRTLRLASPPTWGARAKCLNDWERYDNHRPTRKDESMANRAKRLCAGCPVQAECLNDAMRVELELHPNNFRPDVRYGIRGGLTPGDRAALARKLQEEETGDVA